MKNIITAILNKEINENLSKLSDIKVLCKDILYQEALIEIIKKYPQIDYLILNEKLPGKSKSAEVIEKICEINKQIKIIYFYDEYQEEIRKLNIFRMFFIDELSTELIQNIIKNKEYKSRSEEKGKVICVLGCGGVGKSVFCLQISLYFEDKGKNVAIMSFDKNNTCKKIVKNKDIKIYDLYNSSFNKIKFEIAKAKRRHNIIVVDLSAQDKNNKYLIKSSDTKIVILEPNISEINKTNNLIKKDRLKGNVFLVLNKTNIASIDEEIVKNIFKIKIIGKLKYSSKYNFFINQKQEKIIDKREIKKIVEKITK